MSVHKKLNEARIKFHGQQLKKTGHNKFAGYDYFELGDFLVPAIKVFNEVGLCAVVSFSADTATMTITDLEDGTQIVLTSPMGSAALKGCHEVQNIGAVETYQRRYLWVAALEIVEHDALDATTGKATPERRSIRHSPTQGAVEELDDPDREVYLRMLASRLTNKVDAGHMEDAYTMLVKEQFDDTEYTALWEILKDKSYVRNKLKAFGDARRAAKAANQPTKEAA